MDERFGEIPPDISPEESFPPVTEERHGEEERPPVSEERKAEARARLRQRFPKLTEEDFDEVSREKTRAGKLEIFIQKLMERYKWRRGVCQQQLGSGMDDLRDC